MAITSDNLDGEWNSYMDRLGIEGKKKRDNGYDYTNTGYYVPGMGYFKNEPLVTYDENGQRSVGGGVIYTGQVTEDGGLDSESNDRLHPAYDTLKSETADALRRWHDSRTESESDAALKDLWRAYQATGDFSGDFDEFKAWFNAREQSRTQGLLPVSALHNSRGIATKTADGRPINRDYKSGGFKSTSTPGAVKVKGGGYAWYS